MIYKVEENIIKVYDKSQFNPQHILECGQVFCYKKENDKYIVFPEDKYAEIIELEKYYEIKTFKKEDVDYDIDILANKYVEAIDNECSDAKLTELITMLVHEYRHSFQHINKLPMTYVRYTEAGEDIDAYYTHPMEVDAYAYQEKLADETIEYLVTNLSKNFKSGHEFYKRYHTSFVFDKPESNTVEYEDWEYDMMYDEEEYEF